MESSDKLLEGQFYAIQQFGSFGRGTKLRCIFREKYIEFRAPGKDGPAAKLEYRHIMEATSGTKSEIAQVEKSTLGRAVIGSLLMGSLGAKAGMVSSLQHGGTRSKQVVVRYLIIGYHGKSGKEEFIILQTKDRHIGQEAEQLIRSKIGKPPQATQ